MDFDLSNNCGFFSVFLSSSLDDTYMYDDALTGNYRGIIHHPHHPHWYDEPPYESDPDDFLMAGMGPASQIQVNVSRISINQGPKPCALFHLNVTTNFQTSKLSSSKVKLICIFVGF